MHIDRIRLEHVAMPLRTPWRTAYGEDSHVESILVQIHSGDLAAWAESSSLAAPCYSTEWAGGVFACLRDWLAPAIVGRHIDSGVELQRVLSHFKGNAFAKAALDMAWWVLDAKRQNRPLHRVLGGTHERIRVGADFGVLDSIDELLKKIADAFERGFPRVKLKFRPGWDLDMLRAVRREFPSQTFHIDCNAAYRLSDLEMFRRLDEFELAMIEQPLQYDDLIDHARLQADLSTPICLDESISSLDRARQAIDLGSCRFVNIKPGRVGGLTIAVAIHDMCRDAGIPCWVGGMLESAVGSRICAALATLDNFTYPADIFPTSRFYDDDLASPPLELTSSDSGPVIQCASVPGIESAPDPMRLAECRISSAEIPA